MRQELEATDAVLGDPAAVREFVLSAAQRIGIRITPTKAMDVFRFAVSQASTATVPDAVKFAMPSKNDGEWLISFTSPAPEDAEYLGRNHRFVTALARFLFEEALTKGGAARASRGGVIRTRAVTKLTTILLLRVRYLVEQPGQDAPLLSEEIIVRGFAGGSPKEPKWVDRDEAMRLLTEARPDANVPMPEKRELVGAALAQWPAVDLALRDQITDRATELEKSHKRIRQAVSMRVRELSVNARSALELIVAQLSTLAPTDVANRQKLQFPINDTQTGYQKAVTDRQRLRGVPADREQLIERYQPYNYHDGPVADDPLGLLHELNNADKHRVLHVVSAIGHVGMTLIGPGRAGPFKFGQGASATFGDGAEVHSPEFTLKPIDGGVLTENESPVAEIILTEKSDVRFQPNILVAIRFGAETDRLAGRDVLPTLNQILLRVEEVIAALS